MDTGGHLFYTQRIHQYLFSSDAPVNCKFRNSKLNVTDETYNSKHIETLSRFELENYKFQQEYARTCVSILESLTTVSLGDWATVSPGDWATVSLGDWATVSLGDWATVSLGDWATVSLGDWATVSL